MNILLRKRKSKHNRPGTHEPEGFSMNPKQKKDLERTRLINNHMSDSRKKERDILKDQVKICPCCGQPTCERNDAEKYFKPKNE